MIGEVIVIGDLKLRDDAALNEYERLGERMYSIVSRLPGFLSVKSFKATDGEELTVFRFASEEALEAWRTHPDLQSVVTGACPCADARQDGRGVPST